MSPRASVRRLPGLARLGLSFAAVVAAVFVWELRWGPNRRDPAEVAKEEGVRNLAEIAASLERERQQLRSERAALRAEERRLDLQRFEVEAQRRDVEEMLATLDAGASSLSEDRSRGLLRIARVYESMQPEEAATILAALGPETSTEILRRMRGRAAARVIESLDPVAAVRISERMLRP